MTKSLVIGKKPSCNSYVSLRLGENTVSTAVRKNTVSPTWDETFELAVADVHQQVLFINVMEKEVLARDTPIGDACFALDMVVRDMQGAPKFVNLHNTDTGRLRVRFEFIPDQGALAAGAGVGLLDASGAPTVAGSTSAATANTPGGASAAGTPIPRSRSTSVMGEHAIDDAEVCVTERYGMLERRGEVFHSWQQRFVLARAA